MIKLKCIIFSLLLLMSFTITSTKSIHGQSYTIKSIMKKGTEIFPGAELSVFSFIGLNLSMNNGGDVIIHTILFDKTRAIFRYSDENLKLLVRSTPFQPLNESVFLNISASAINDNGVIVFAGNLSGKQGIYKYSGDHIDPLVMAGDQIIGLESTIEEIIFLRISLNNIGSIVFNATLSDGSKGLFVFTGQSIKPVMLIGDRFPLFSENSRVIFVGSPNINDKNEIVFMACIEDSDDNICDDAIFLFRDEEIVPIVLPEQELPGTNGKIIANSQGINPVIGNNSEILFWAAYTTPGRQVPNTSIGTKQGLFLWSGTDIKPIILFANPVPGLNDFYRNIESTLGPNAINDFGEFVSGFHSAVNKGGVMLFTDNNTVPVFLGKFLKLDTEILFIDSTDFNNSGDIVFMGTDASINQGIFFAKKEDVILSIFEVKRVDIANDSKRGLKVKGTGFQPGARVSFSGIGIRTLSTEFNTSTTLIATIQIQPDVKPGFRDVIVTNPVGEETVFENGFTVVR